MKAYLFPGQGSQKVGMGGTLFEEFPRLTKQADDILGYSIKELCLNDSDLNLDQTEYTQPALYVVNALSYQKTIKEGEKQPDFVAGHSLGEYNALQAAGVISFQDGLKLVKKRGELMSRAKNGGMAAILNSSENQIKEIIKKAQLTIDIANLNSPSQIVISGLKEEVNKAQSYFEEANTIFIPLNTSGAFHSRYMKEAENEFEKIVKTITFSKPEIPVIANFTGKPYEVENMKDTLVKQISNSVRWMDGMMYLIKQGEMDFEELGVGNVLTKLTQKIRNEYNSLVDKKNVQFENDIEMSTNKEVSFQSKNENILSVEPKEHHSSAKLVEQWNKTCPIGIKVLSDLYDNELETRTEAMLLFGHRAAVYVKGYNGYFDLREVKVVD